MKEVGQIFLSWRQGFGKERHIVGVIKRNRIDGVSFRYFTEKVEKAKQEGFSPYTEFPNINQIYEGPSVLDIFGQRIIKSERSDVSDFFDFWEIDQKFRDDKYYLLAHTQGLMPTDNFEFLADYNPKRDLRFSTDLATLSILKLPSGTVQVGDQLRYELEPHNEFDSEAVKVFKDDLHIGYIKKVHCRVFHKSSKRNLCLQVKAVDQNGVIKKIFVKVFTCS